MGTSRRPNLMNAISSDQFLLTLACSVLKVSGEDRVTTLPSKRCQAWVLQPASIRRNSHMPLAFGADRHLFELEPTEAAANALVGLLEGGLEDRAIFIVLGPLALARTTPTQFKKSLHGVTLSLVHPRQCLRREGVILEHCGDEDLQDTEARNRPRSFSVQKVFHPMPSFDKRCSHFGTDQHILRPLPRSQKKPGGIRTAPGHTRNMFLKRHGFCSFVRTSRWFEKS